jgi:hypothetical protein
VTFVSGRRGVTGNVFFANGRCVFVVGNAIRDATAPTRPAHEHLRRSVACIRQMRLGCLAVLAVLAAGRTVASRRVASRSSLA